MTREINVNGGRSFIVSVAFVSFTIIGGVVGVFWQLAAIKSDVAVLQVKVETLNTSLDKQLLKIEGRIERLEP